VVSESSTSRFATSLARSPPYDIAGAVDDIFDPCVSLHAALCSGRCSQPGAIRSEKVLSCSLGARLVGVGAVRGVHMVSTGWACRAGLTAHQPSALFGSEMQIGDRMSRGGNGRRGGVGNGGGVGSDFHKNKKLLNERIKSIASMQELCDLIHASSTQFNHVNVATAFRQVLQMPRDGVSQD
jgi:hypothetical protein